VNFLRAPRKATPPRALPAQAFLRQCVQHLHVAVPTLILTGGSPGTGKTTLANDLADALGVLVLSSDEVRKDLVGVAHDQHAFAPPGVGIYHPRSAEQTYEDTDPAGRRVHRTR
jgi:hypothetical protein